jgi:SAP domain
MESIIRCVESVIRDSFVPFVVSKCEGIEVAEMENLVALWMEDVFTLKGASKADQVVGVTKAKPVKAAAAAKSKPKKTSPKHSSDEECTSVVQYDSMKVPELKALCKQRGLSVTGTKAQLLSRLNGVVEPLKVKNQKKPKQSDDSDDEKAAATAKKVYDADTDSEVEQVVRKPPTSHGHFVSESENETPKKDVKNQSADDSEQDAKPRKRLTKKSTSKLQKPMGKPKSLPKQTIPAVVCKITEITDELVTEEDEFGNKIHKETGFAFNKDQEVFGTVDEEGHIVSLNKDQVAKCKQMGLLYVDPDELSSDEE